MIWPTVGLCLIFLLHFNPAIAVEPEPIETGLRRIDDYFARRHPHDLQPDEAIELAQIWLDSESASEEVNKPVEALKLFLSLPKLDDESSCNAEGLKIVVEYRTAVGSLTDRRTATQRVGFHYLLRHARICLKQYYDSFSRVMSGLAKTDIERIEKFMNLVYRYEGLLYTLKGFIQNNSGRGHQLEYIRTIGESEKGLKFKAIRIKKVLSVLANGQELPHDLKGLETIFDEFVYKPCERLTQALGPDIYDPLMEDYKAFLLLLPDQGCFGPFKDPNLSKTDFYSSIAYVRSCRFFFQGIDKVALLNSILEVQQETRSDQSLDRAMSL